MNEDDWYYEEGAEEEDYGSDYKIYFGELFSFSSSTNSSTSTVASSY